MNRIEAGIVALAGFVLMFGGMGGVELSQTDDQMYVSLGLVVLGLLAQWAAIRAMQINNWE